MWKKAGEAWCKVLSEHKSQGTEEYHEKPCLNYSKIAVVLFKSSSIRVMRCIRVRFRKARYLRKVGYRVESDMIGRAEMTRIRAHKSLRLTLTASL